MSSQLKPSGQKSVLEIILEWSEVRPAWQRDALRRIVLNGALAGDDIAELVELCKKEKGATNIAIAPKPLEASDLPANPGVGEAISLLSISGVEGVNQLAPEQTVEFEPFSLTIVYGDNGAGKSGYARILKRTCRARSPGQIVSNVFDPEAAAVASATMAYSIGGTSQATARWTDNGKPHPVLSAVSVFDRDSGAVHLRDKNEVAFRPFGLDVPDELAAGCQGVKDALTAELQSLEASRDPIFVQPSWKSSTAVGKVLSNLRSDTDLSVLAGLAEVSDPERERHRRLSEDLSKDPLKASADQTVYADAIRQLSQTLARVASDNSDEALFALKAKADDARSKRAAANLAAEGAYAQAAVSGVGGEVWLALWNAARRYSEHVAYSGQQFPPTSEGVVCVLCHQPLDDEARTRLHDFDSFVKGDTERQAKVAEVAFDTAQADFQAKPFRVAPIAATRRRIALADPELARAILKYLASARRRRRCCEKSLSSEEPLELPDLAPDPASAVTECEAAARAYASELKQAADLEGRKKLEAERDELSDRINLAGLLDKANAEVERLGSLQLIRECIADTATNVITRLGNDIADKVITPRIRDRFQEEIVKLAADRVRVEVVRSGGKYGSPHYQARLLANPQAKVPDILSEGEQTCVALALFLTELSTASHASTLVFDDPVSSLDHRWRRKVAERLVDESANRQIIVFTHDLIFVNDLDDLSFQRGMPRKLMSVGRGPAGAGVVSEGLPWVAAKLPQRIDQLEKEVRAAKVLYDANDEDQYRNAAFQIYNRLRNSWERAIEDVAFNGVILRHRDYINSKHLRKTTVLSEADCDEFDAGFKKCCDQVDAHDPSRGRNAPPPAPDEIMRDVKALNSWVSSIRGRQKSVGAA